MQTAREIDRHVGLRVNAARLARGKTLAEVGAPLGKTYQQIQKYERGANRISASVLWRLAIFLDVPLLSFFEGLPGVDGAPTGTPDLIQAAIVRQHVRALAEALAQSPGK